MAERLGRDLADRRLVIVRRPRGRRLDSSAHNGALSRVITGMSLGVVMVGSERYSGSLITARLLPVETGTSERRAMLVEESLASGELAFVQCSYRRRIAPLG